MPVADTDLDVRELWACWVMPTRSPESGSVILSFLSPSDDSEMNRKDRSITISAREVASDVRDAARKLYLALVADIGSASLGDNITLRQSLAIPGKASRWWFHPVAFKDCENDPTYNCVIAILTIQAVAVQYGIKKVLLFGAPHEVASVLKSDFIVVPKQLKRPYLSWTFWRGLAARFLYAGKTLRDWYLTRRYDNHPTGRWEVVFSGFWDWSLWWDEERGSIQDRYFKRLPDELKYEFGASVGWFAWYEPRRQGQLKNRRRAEVLAPLQQCTDVAILQRFFTPWDILKSVFDFQPVVTFLRLQGRPEFKELFRKNGLDYFPLFARTLVYGFLNSSLPHFELVALATERACRKYRPKVTMSFLEHFPYSRAHYEGVRQARCGTVCGAVQHASYSHDKTFLFFHPVVEFKGEPEGIYVPHPDLVFSMGEFGRQLFLECGYEAEDVILTGSTRYDRVRYQANRCPDENRKARVSETSILMVATLNLTMEIDMLEAVCTAAHGLKGIRLLFRNHPMRRIESHSKFNLYKAQVELTEGSLEEDLNRADLILFTYSTVAEEAFVNGKTVWQWKPLGFDGSALAEIAPIPRFGSVRELRHALQTFQANQSTFMPDEETQRMVLQKLFSPSDGGAANRIADVITKRIFSLPGQRRFSDSVRAIRGV